MIPRLFTSDPVYDAEMYAYDRNGNVTGYCACCGGEIFGKTRVFDADVYILDDHGRMIHPTLDCMFSAFNGGRLLGWLVDDLGESNVARRFFGKAKELREWFLQRKTFNGTLVDMLKEDFYITDIERNVLETMKDPEKWLYEQCEGRGWVQR